MIDPSRLMRMASAFQESCLLFAASDLGIFQALAERGTADSSQLAGALHLDERGTRLLLDACVAIGLLEKKAEQYQNSPESAAFLVPGRPGKRPRDAPGRPRFDQHDAGAPDRRRGLQSQYPRRHA